MNPETQASVVACLKSMTLLFRMSLVGATQKVAKHGLEIVRDAEAVIDKAETELRALKPTGGE